MREYSTSSDLLCKAGSVAECEAATSEGAFTTAKLPVTAGLQRS